MSCGVVCWGREWLRICNSAIKNFIGIVFCVPHDRMLRFEEVVRFVV